MSKVEEALQLFKEGYSCAQAMFAAYAKDYGMNYEMALKMSQAFGEGMGGMRGECGVVTAATMIIGLAHGEAKPSDGKAMMKTYQLVRRFSEGFEKEHHATVCKQLLEGRSGNHYDICSKYITTACHLLDEILI